MKTLDNDLVRGGGRWQKLKNDYSWNKFNNFGSYCQMLFFTNTILALKLLKNCCQAAKFCHLVAQMFKVIKVYVHHRLKKKIHLNDSVIALIIAVTSHWLLKEIQKGKNTIITDAIINKNQLFKTMGWHDSHAEKSTENESRSLKMLHFSLLITIF